MKFLIAGLLSLGMMGMSVITHASESMPAFGCNSVEQGVRTALSGTKKEYLQKIVIRQKKSILIAALRLICNSLGYIISCKRILGQP